MGWGCSTNRESSRFSNTAQDSGNDRWVRACMLSHFSCVWLCSPMDWSPPGSSVHEILQARILEWIAMPSSMGSSQPRDWTCVSCLGRLILYLWATREVPTTEQPKSVSTPSYRGILNNCRFIIKGNFTFFYLNLSHLRSAPGEAYLKNQTSSLRFFPVEKETRAWKTFLSVCFHSY